LLCLFRPGRNVENFVQDITINYRMYCTVCTLSK